MAKRREFKRGISGKTVASVQVLIEEADGSDGFEVKFTDKTGLFVALRQPGLQVEAAELRSWKTGDDGKLLKKFV